MNSKKVSVANVVVAPAGSDYSTLSCPICRNDYLHQGRITAFDRGEDDETVVKTAVQDGMVSSHMVASVGSGNPSTRRHGLRLAFECENCATLRLDLTISQHKGETHIAWEFIIDPDSRDKS